MNKFLNLRFYTVCGILLVAALSRLLPHPPNFTPITALALFGGATFSRKSLAFLLPLGAMFISDVGIELTTGYGFYGDMWVTYVAFLSISAIGLLLRRNKNVLTIGGAAIFSSVWFFLLSNFGVWALTSLYPRTVEGLYASYAGGLPYFRWTFLGDLVYTGVLFGGFALARRAFPSLDEQPLPARV